MVEFNKLSYKINNNLIINNLTYQFEEGKITTIIGPSGSGKTTIFELIENLIQPSEGIIKVKNTTITNSNKIKDINEYRAKIGYLFQNANEQMFLNSVYEEIVFGLKHYHYKENKQDKIITDSLLLMGLDKTYSNKNPFKLSNGEKTKVALATILALNPKIILLDEPTIGLDAKSINNLIKLLKKISTQYQKTIIINTNDIEFLCKVSDNTIILNKGTIISSGKTKDILENIELLKENNVEILPIVNFIYLAKSKKKIDLAYTLDINELIKDIYRHV